MFDCTTTTLGMKGTLFRVEFLGCSLELESYRSVVAFYHFHIVCFNQTDLWEFTCGFGTKLPGFTTARSAEPVRAKQNSEPPC